VDVAVIELDLDAPPAPAPSRTPARRYRPAGLVVVCLLVLALGGAAPGTSVLLQPAGVVPLTGPDTGYAILGGTIYTVAATDRERVTSAWRIDPLHRIWSVSVPAPPGRVTANGLSRKGGYLLLDGRPGSRVIDVGTGAVRWSSPMTVQMVNPRVGVVAQTTFRPGTEYDESSGDPGPLFFSATGQPYTQSALRTELEAVDLATGRRRWSVTEPGSVFAVSANRDANTLIVVSAGRLSVRAGDTGALLRERVLPPSPADQLSFAQVIGDVVLVRTGAWKLGGVVAAYAADTLAPLWQAPEEPDEPGDGSCVEMICRSGRDGLAVLDPRTGTPTWRAGRGAALVALGDDVLETAADSSRPVRVYDKATGALRADLGDWTGAGASPGGPLVVTRYEQEAGTTAFGVLGPGATTVQPLGHADSVVNDCSADHRVIVCRVPDGLEVWSYSP
jgi:hypothetical protein